VCACRSTRPAVRVNECVLCARGGIRVPPESHRYPLRIARNTRTHTHTTRIHSHTHPHTHTQAQPHPSHSKSLCIDDAISGLQRSARGRLQEHRRLLSSTHKASFLADRLLRRDRRKWFAGMASEGSLEAPEKKEGLLGAAPESKQPESVGELCREPGRIWKSPFTQPPFPKETPPEEVHAH
jgi:hypothetical protein